MMRDNLTEEDAKKKWCPLARSGDTRDEGRVSVNRCGNAADMDCFCIASACMAWRWTDGYYETVTMDNRCIDEEMTKQKGIKWIGHTNGLPPKPTGDRWEPLSEPMQADGFVEGILQQKWRRPKDFRHGICGAFR